MSITQFKIENNWLERVFSIDGNNTFQTVSLINKQNQHELLQQGGEEFQFIGYFGEAIRVFKCTDFNYISHEYINVEDAQVLLVNLVLKTKGDSDFNPFAIGKWDEVTGTLKIQLEFRAYHHHPVIRKRIQISNEYSFAIRLQNLTWEDLKLSNKNSRTVQHYFLTRCSESAVDTMDDSVMAINWTGTQDGLFVATEAPGAMKHMELFKDRDRIRISYNYREETIFEWQLGSMETFETDYCFMLPFASICWQDAADTVLRSFVEHKLTLCKPGDVPSFTINTWETFYNEISEDIVLENIRIAAEMGVDAYQLDCGWYVNHGEYSPHPTKFPNGLEPVVDACRRNNMKLGLWMSVPNVYIHSSVALEHPEWFLLDENGNHGFMIGWKETEIMCLDCDYKYWIVNQMDSVIKKYGIELLKLDLASVRDPYNPGKSVGCHAKGHHHPTKQSSHLRIYRAMFWIIDELRERNPSCLIDLTFELYGVMHGMDLALIQHAHQNWFVNEDTPWLDNLRRLIHTRSRIVPSYTLNFGSCHLTEPLSQKYGFWSALCAHGLYYADLRKLSKEEVDFYKHWINWVKEYRKKVDFYAYHKVSDVFPVSDAPDHVDRRFHPYSFYEAARVKSSAELWDGVAKCNEDGEGLVLVFRPEQSTVTASFIRFPWIKADALYKVTSVLDNRSLGLFNGLRLQHGLEVMIPEAPGVAVLDLFIYQPQ